MMVSLDGYFEGENHDISWHQVDGEFGKFAVEQMEEVGTILFGRTTYELMADFWPTEQARKADAETAELMNSLPKIVFSKTLQNVSETEHWKNVTLLHEVNIDEIKKLKSEAVPPSQNSEKAKNIAILGSNKLLVELTKLGLVDEFRIMVNPIVIGKGTPLFHGIKEKLSLKLLRTRQFGNGNMLITYSPDEV